MKLIIAGGRDLCGEHHFAAMSRAVHLVLHGARVVPRDLEIVSGKQTGMDALGERWAAAYRIKVTPFPADWTAHGLKAGPIRNRQMAAYADFAVVVWNGKSRGSSDMLKAMREAGKPALSWIVTP